MLWLVSRLVVAGAVLAGGAYAAGYRWDDSTERRVRAAGAEAGERLGEKADRAKTGLSAAALTAKVKGKIALDDTLDGSRINIDTEGNVVTLRGSVDSTRQRQRALQLARETEGVRSVVDRLDVKQAARR